MKAGKFSYNEIYLYIKGDNLCIVLRRIKDSYKVLKITLLSMCRWYLTVQAGGQLMGVGFLLPCGLWGLNSDTQAWRQAPLLLSHLSTP